MEVRTLEEIVERIVREIAGEKPGNSEYEKPALINRDDEVLEDITAADLKRQYLVENPKNKEAFLEMKLKTPARLGIGRAGAKI